MMLQDDTILQARSVNKSYQMGQTELHVLRDVSLTVKAGEFLAIMGPSGSGKSTLMHLLGALDLPDSGSVEFLGRDFLRLSSGERERARNRDIGFVFQFYHLLPELTVLENVLVPGMVGQSWLGWLKNKRRIRAEAEAVLEKMKLESRLGHRPSELSGGESQRVAIARALVGRPKLLLADEPTGNLDATTGREILAVLAELNRAGQTVVMVTHDTEVASVAHRCVHLIDGAIAGTTTDGGAR